MMPTGDVEQQRAWAIVARIVAVTGHGPAKIAVMAGLSKATLTRIYPKIKTSYTLSDRTIGKLRRAFPEALADSNVYNTPDGFHRTKQANSPDTYDEEQEFARTTIERIVRATGLSPSAIALQAGLSPSTVTRMFPHPMVGYTLSSRSIRKLRDAFPDSFITETGINITPWETLMVQDNEKPDGKGMIPVFSLTLLDDHNDTPVEGSPMGWEFASLVRDSSTSWIEYLPAHHHPDRYFAVFVPGDAMHPRFRAGEWIIVDRLRPVVRESGSLLTLKRNSGSQVTCIAELVYRDREKIVFLQHGCKQKSEFSIDRVVSLYRITAVTSVAHL